VRFGSCEFDLDACQLSRDGQVVPLSPKAFELLRILVSERPRALTKAELHKRIWPDTYVTDDSLTRIVAEARIAIGDRARTPTFLLTKHGFGYAFLLVADRPTPLKRCRSDCFTLSDGNREPVAPHAGCDDRSREGNW
jgi:DNA-binding winged helix-turn-helix (wHTH) protein